MDFVFQIDYVNCKKNKKIIPALNRVEPSPARKCRVLYRAELEFEILISIELESSFELE